MRNNKTPKDIVFYFDTNVILDIVKDRRPSSVQLLELIMRNNLLCISSQFALMELIEQEKVSEYAKKLLVENKMEINQICREYRQCNLKNEELKKFNNDFNEKLRLIDYIKFLYLEKDGWEMALQLVKETNILASDCIHLSVFMIVAADCLVTSDSHFAKFANSYFAKFENSHFTEDEKKRDFECLSPEGALQKIERF